MIIYSFYRFKKPNATKGLFSYSWTIQGSLMAADCPTPYIAPWQQVRFAILPQKEQKNNSHKTDILKISTLIIIAWL